MCRGIASAISFFFQKIDNIIRSVIEGGREGGREAGRELLYCNLMQQKYCLTS